MNSNPILHYILSDWLQNQLEAEMHTLTALHARLVPLVEAHPDDEEDLTIIQDSLIQLHNLIVARPTNTDTQPLYQRMHDLRTPINALLGFGQLFLEMPDEISADLHAALNSVYWQAIYLLNIINTTTDFIRYKQQQGMFVGYRVRCDLRNEWRIVAAQQLILSADAAPSLWVRADRARLRQALYMLRGWAHAQSQSAPQVTLSATDTHAALTLTLQTPTPADAARALLAAEWQFGTSAAVNLWEMGLNISAAIIESHTGTLRIEPTPNADGLYIHVALPLE